jgi:hypothetical protein
MKQKPGQLHWRPGFLHYFEERPIGSLKIARQRIVEGPDLMQTVLTMVESEQDVFSCACVRSVPKPGWCNFPQTSSR